jgi:site-specific recombinase XerD
MRNWVYAPRGSLSLEEWHALLKGAQPRQETTLPWLLGGAGLRVSEVAALKVEHLDGAVGFLIVVDSKGRKLRTPILPVPVPEALKSYLNSRDGIMSSRAEIMAIYRPGRSRDPWI